MWFYGACKCVHVWRPFHTNRKCTLQNAKILSEQFTSIDELIYAPLVTFVTFAKLSNCGYSFNTHFQSENRKQIGLSFVWIYIQNLPKTTETITKMKEKDAIFYVFNIEFPFYFIKFELAHFLSYINSICIFFFLVGKFV